MLITIIASVLLTLFSKNIYNSIVLFSKTKKFNDVLNKYGIFIDEISAEEAALSLLQKEVIFNWRPQIVDQPIVSNVVNFSDINIKKVNKNKNDYPRHKAIRMDDGKFTTGQRTI